MSEIGQFRPVYSRDDIPHLQDLLHKATPHLRKRCFTDRFMNW